MSNERPLTTFLPDKPIVEIDFTQYYPSLFDMERWQTIWRLPHD